MALAKIAEYASQPIFEKLSEIKSAYEEGSVITVDNSISVFAKLCKANGSYAETVFPIIINHFQKCKPREVPQHAERAAICFNSENASDFIKVLEERRSGLTPPQQARINKLLKKTSCPAAITHCSVKKGSLNITISKKSIIMKLVIYREETYDHFN